jgi:hypothetical protein
VIIETISSPLVSASRRVAAVHTLVACPGTPARGSLRTVATGERNHQMSLRRTTALLASIAALALTPSAAQAAGDDTKAPDLPRAAAKSLKGCKKAGRKRAPRRCRRPAAPTSTRDASLVITYGDDPNGIPLVIDNSTRWVDFGWSPAYRASGGWWYAVHYYRLVSGGSVLRYQAHYYYWTGSSWQWYGSVV